MNEGKVDCFVLTSAEAMALCHVFNVQQTGNILDCQLSPD